MGRHSQVRGLAYLSSLDIWVTKLRATCPSPKPGDEAPARDGLGLSRPELLFPFCSRHSGEKGEMGGSVSVGWQREALPADKDVNWNPRTEKGHKILPASVPTSTPVGCSSPTPAPRSDVRQREGRERRGCWEGVEGREPGKGRGCGEETQGDGVQSLSTHVHWRLCRPSTSARGLPHFPTHKQQQETWCLVVSEVRGFTS